MMHSNWVKSVVQFWCVWTHVLRASCSFYSTNHSCPILPTKPGLWFLVSVSEALVSSRGPGRAMMSWHKRSGGHHRHVWCNIFSVATWEISRRDKWHLLSTLRLSLRLFSFYWVVQRPLLPCSGDNVVCGYAAAERPCCHGFNLL